MAKILIIDDDLDMRQVVARMLKAKGHETVAVADGMFAMKVIREQRPDLIILDILMPGLDGCALGYHLKHDSEFADIPIMVLSSLGDKSYLGDEIAADHFMAKPFKGEILTATVEELLAKGAAKPAAARKEVAPRASKRKALAVLLPAIFITVLLVGALVALNTAGPGLAAAGTSAPTQGEISATADRLFIYSVPAALGILMYVACSLNRLVRSVKKVDS